MALFTIKHLKRYKFIVTILKWLVVFVLLVLGLTFFKLIHDGIKLMDQTKFCYALFAANAILCNSLMGLARSPIFQDRFNKNHQKLIYLASLRFLYASILSLMMSAWIFIYTKESFFGHDLSTSYVWVEPIIYWTLTAVVGVSLLLTMNGLYLFFKWANLALNKTTSEMEEEN